jgi:hypothetical protein
MHTHLFTSIYLIRGIRAIRGCKSEEKASTILTGLYKTKPICRRCKIEVKPVLTKDYEEKARLAGESKQSQTKPILGKANVKMGDFSDLNELGPPMCSAGFDGRRASVYNHAAKRQYAGHTGQVLRKGHGLIQEG